MINHKEITECDLNPLLVSEDDRIYAIDIRIKCEDKEYEKKKFY